MNTSDRKRMNRFENKLDLIGDSVIRIEEHMIGVDKDLKTLCRDHYDHENRIRNIENWRNKTTGIAAGVSMVVSTVFILIKMLIDKLKGG